MSGRNGGEHGVSSSKTDNRSLVMGRTSAASDGPGAPVGPVIPLTMAVALRFGGRTWLKTLFAAARRFPKIPEPMYKLAFIHFLRWTIVEDVPDGHGGRRKLHPAMLLFEGDFDGNVFQYIDMFKRAVPVREWSVWSPGRGFPGLYPVSGFVKWVQGQSVEPDQYYFAYPNATTKTVRAGLRVQEALDAFRDAVADITDPDEWLARFEELVAAVQREI